MAWTAPSEPPVMKSSSPLMVATVGVEKLELSGREPGSDHQTGVPSSLFIARKRLPPLAWSPHDELFMPITTRSSAIAGLGKRPPYPDTRPHCSVSWRRHLMLPSLSKQMKCPCVPCQ